MAGRLGFGTFAASHCSHNRMIKLAILDLYEGYANQGMRCIRDIVHQFSIDHKLDIEVKEFDVRRHNEVPDLSFDLFISSGGPGSPLESEGSEWERHYFQWLHSVEEWNREQGNYPKKHVFFICHSFQLACRHYQLGNVCKRKSTSFGVFPVHMLMGGEQEPVFAGLKDPFYAVDSRDFQVISPNHARIREMGAQILCIEKSRPHVPLERAIMAIRFNDYFFGTQFHPEADAVGMSMYLRSEERRQTVIDNYGLEKWQSMIEHLEDPDKILYTHDRVLPNFLKQAVRQLQEATAA